MITAYHGSAYRFERFDLSKLGSGDGRRVGGHGIYFNTVPEIAMEYALIGGGLYEANIYEHGGWWLDLDEPTEDFTKYYRVLTDPQKEEINDFSDCYNDNLYKYFQAIWGEKGAVYVLSKIGCLGTTFLDRGTMVAVAMRTNRPDLLEEGKGRNYVVFDPLTIKIINFTPYE